MLLHEIHNHFEPDIIFFFKFIPKFQYNSRQSSSMQLKIKVLYNRRKYVKKSNRYS